SLYKSQDPFQVIGVKPGEISLVSEPGELAFGIAPGVLLQQPYHFLLVIKAVEVPVYFLVANGLKGVVVTVAGYSLRFRYQALLQHLVYPLVDPVVEYIPVPVEGDQYLPERP